MNYSISILQFNVLLQKNIHILWMFLILDFNLQHQMREFHELQ